MLHQTTSGPVVPISRGDQVRQATRAENTNCAYLGHWTWFRNWAGREERSLSDDLEPARYTEKQAAGRGRGGQALSGRQKMSGRLCNI